MNLAVIANPEKYSVKEPFIETLKWADEHEVQVFFSRILNNLYDGKNHHSSYVTETEEKAINKADIIVAIGGDGTMLYVARLIKNIKKPVLGINSGRLGFMANTQMESLEEALICLKEGNYRLKRRYLLQAEDANSNRYYALNEFLFSKRDSTSMIMVKAEFNGMFINRYWADGLIVASPTGSTAYNLSSDGPIVMPESNVMVLTPINPHTLTTRSLVLPSDKPLKITVKKQQHKVAFSYDGKICDIPQYPLEVYIQRSDFSVDLVELPEQSYFDTLRHKLMWGADYRKRT
jgi:NAD+ kinase